MDAAGPPVPEPGTAPRGSDRRHTFPGRQCRINLRLAPGEEHDIRTAAARCGLTPSGFCAEAALAAAQRPAAPGDSKPGDDETGRARCLIAPGGGPGGATRAELTTLQRDLFAARTAVGRVGTNLNQAVAQYNATGEPPVWLARVVAMCGRALQTLDTAASTIHRRLR